MKKKRLLLFSFEYPPKCGGAGRVAYDSTSLLFEKGFDFEVLTTRYPNLKKHDNVNYHLISYIPVLFPLFFFFKLRKLLKKNYDTIILNDVGSMLVMSLFFKKYFSKCIVFIHGTEFEIIVTKPKFLFRIVNFKKSFISLLSSCYKIVCVSDYMKRKAMSFLPKISEDRFWVVHNGVNKKIFFPQKTDIFDKYLKSKDSKIFFSASRIIEMKGYGDFYKIFKRLDPIKKNLYWFIAGEGDFKNTICDMAQKDSLNDRIFFLGNLDSETLRQCYSSCDVFILLSRYEEAYGLVYLEALSCGVPVIGNDLGGVNEVIQNTVNGFLVKSAEDCFDVLNNKMYESIKKEDIFTSIPNYSAEKETFIQYLY